MVISNLPSERLCHSIGGFGGGRARGIDWIVLMMVLSIQSRPAPGDSMGQVSPRLPILHYYFELFHALAWGLGAALMVLDNLRSIQTLLHPLIHFAQLVLPRKRTLGLKKIYQQFDVCRMGSKGKDYRVNLSSFFLASLLPP